ncbi:MAG: branched-chain amino acid ABC transporter substrate-binding protein [Chloroflexi bacterium]|nr:branched-chain amino acid ABC transporter substrate-binding protein [Chloroflexota bacterium]
MKRFFSALTVLIVAGLLLSACGGMTTYTCTDPLGCIAVGSGESLKIATLLTMSGPDQVYGIDAVRGVEIAISDEGKLLGHNVELVKVDDLCTEQGGKDGATQLAQDSQIIGVIGATCSSASAPAAKILSDAGTVMISPSSTAPSLTDPVLHQPGFFRAIYNDKAQGKAVAEFAFSVLGMRRMLTIHDGTPYPKELQQAACDSFKQLGGTCVGQIDLSARPNISTDLQLTSALNPDVVYYPVYTEDGIAITKAIFDLGMGNLALISSDGLLSSDFIKQTEPNSEGMYMSGPAEVQESESFTQKYVSRYGEQFIAAYHLQGYDASNMLFYAIQQSAVVVGDKLYIQRQKLRDALYGIRGMKGLSSDITCSPVGDCSQPNIEIFQVADSKFRSIYP